MSEWFALLLILALVAAVLRPLFWSLHRATYPLDPDPNGWIVTRRSIFDHVIGFIQFGFALVWIFFGLAAPLYLEESAPAISYTMLAIMLVMGILFLHAFFFAYLSRIRFNDEKLEYKSVFRNISVFWNEVTEIRMGMNGPSIRTIYGAFSISNTRRGFYQLLDTARKNSVLIQKSPYLKPHDAYWPYRKKTK